MNNKMKHKGSSIGMLLFGLAVVAAGIVLIMLNVGAISAVWKPILFSWQMLLIVMGLINLLNWNRHHFFGGLVTLFVGAFFLIPKLIIAFPDTFYGWNPDFAQNFWPLLLVVIGLLIVFGSIFKPKRKKDWSYTKFTDEFSGNKENIGGTFDKNVIFSGGEYIVLDPVFSGGELNAVFGGIDLDLRKTNLAEGDTVLEVNAVFGGIDIKIPSDWNIKSEVSCILGGIEDKREKTNDFIPNRRLILTGGCIFGGCSIKN